MSEEKEMDIFDYYGVMDRSSVVLLNFVDIRDMVQNHPTLGPDAENLVQSLNNFYQKAGEVFDKEISFYDEEE